MTTHFCEKICEYCLDPPTVPYLGRNNIPDYLHAGSHDAGLSIEVPLTGIFNVAILIEFPDDAAVPINLGQIPYIMVASVGYIIGLGKETLFLLLFLFFYFPSRFPSYIANAWTINV